MYLAKELEDYADQHRPKDAARLPCPAKKRRQKRSHVPVLTQEKPEREVPHPANKTYLHPWPYSQLVNRCKTALPQQSLPAFDVQTRRRSLGVTANTVLTDVGHTVVAYVACMWPHTKTTSPVPFANLQAEEASILIDCLLSSLQQGHHSSATDGFLWCKNDTG